MRPRWVLTQKRSVMNFGSSVNEKLTPLYDIHLDNSATLINFFDWKLPLYFSGIIEEHNLVRNYAGLFDVSHMCRIEIQYETVRNLDNFLPFNLHDIHIGSVKYSILFNDLGSIIDDLLIYRLDNKILMVTNASRRKVVLNFLSKIEGLIYTELSNTAQLSVQGPKSASIMSKIFINSDKMKFLRVKNFEYNNSSFLVSRTGYTGEDGFEVIAEKDKICNLVVKLLKNKKLNLIGLGARDSLRLEAGLCLYGNEIDEKISPLEANISWVLDKKKLESENFYGANLIKKELITGSSRKRYGFLVENRYIARNGNLIVDSNGKNIGYITSGCYSPTLKKSICMGLVNTMCAENQDLFVNIRNRNIKVFKTTLPFVKHKYNK